MRRDRALAIVWVFMLGIMMVTTIDLAAAWTSYYVGHPDADPPWYVSLPLLLCLIAALVWGLDDVRKLWRDEGTRR